MSRRQGPLDHLTIIDCTMAYAGPFGTVLLADLGANVIKVEPPGGDGFRHTAPHPRDRARTGEPGGADYGMPFASVNRNKRSIALDLKDAEDRAVFFQLCEQADAVVENMRAGVMDELGVGYDAIRQHNPKIVYGTVRGYGDPRTGESPYADWPCLDVAGQAVGGLVEATGDLFPVAISDIYPGTLMALGLLAAVNRAQLTGEGSFFDVSMYDSVVTLLKSNVAAYSMTGKEPSREMRALVPFGLFPAADGRVAIAAPVERHWAALCEAMGREDLITDERTRTNRLRSENREFTIAQLTAWTTTLTKAEIMSRIGGKVPAGPAHTMAEVFADAHIEAREMLETAELPGDNPAIQMAGNPIKFWQQPTGLYQSPPKHGEHTDEILAEFGITRASKTRS